MTPAARERLRARKKKAHRLLAKIKKLFGADPTAIGDCAELLALAAEQFVDTEDPWRQSARWTCDNNWRVEVARGCGSDPRVFDGTLKKQLRARGKK